MVVLHSKIFLLVIKSRKRKVLSKFDLENYFQITNLKFRIFYINYLVKEDSL